MSKFRGSFSDRPEVTFYLMRGGTVTFDASRPLGVGVADWQRGVQMVELSISRTFTDHGTASMTFACSNRQWATDFLDTLHLGDYFVARLPHSDPALSTVLEFGFVDSITIGESAAPLKSECIVDVGCQMWGALLSRAEIWFDILSEGIIGATAFSKALFDNKATNVGPSATIFALLRGLTRTLATKPNNSEWQLPQALKLPPVIGGASGRALVDTIAFDGVRSLHSYPARRSGLAPTLYTPEVGALWDLLMQWSEPSFLELYTDLELWSVSPPAWDPQGRVPRSAPVETQGSGFHPVVRLRDRPFPSTTLKTAATGRAWLSWGDPNQPWQKLPTLDLRREDVARLVLGRHGEERRNSFFITCSLPGGVAGTYHAFMSPHVLKKQARLYGARRMDLHTPYVPYRASDAGDKGQPFDPSGLSALKERGAHFYGANHLFFSGEVEMTTVQPGLRLGTRLHIDQGDTDAGTLLGYVEGYGHSWSLGTGMRSTAMLTRALYQRPGRGYTRQIQNTVEEQDDVSLFADPASSIA